MKVLDASVVIDYLDGDRGAFEYIEAHSDEPLVMGTPTLLEVAIGPLHDRSFDVTPADVLKTLAWVEPHRVTTETVQHALDVVYEIGYEAPRLTMADAIVLGLGREVDATVVSGDSDHTHERVNAVVDVEEYN